METVKLSFYQKNKDRINAERRAKYANDEIHKKKIQERNKLFQENNRSYYAEYYRKTIESRKDELSAYNKRYKKENAFLVNSTNAKRRASKKSRMPTWLTKEDLRLIQSLYKKAKILSTETGTKHNVDHIVPLQGKTVSGLHVPWNLQVIKEKDNLQKNNRFWPDMWTE